MEAWRMLGLALERVPSGALVRRRERSVEAVGAGR
jgi:hypothetical protein